jgi:hypothetical protein
MLKKRLLPTLAFTAPARHSWAASAAATAAGAYLLRWLLLG